MDWGDDDEFDDEEDHLDDEEDEESDWDGEFDDQVDPLDDEEEEEMDWEEDEIRKDLLEEFLVEIEDMLKEKEEAQKKEEERIEEIKKFEARRQPPKPLAIKLIEKRNENNMKNSISSNIVR